MVTTNPLNDSSNPSPQAADTGASAGPDGAGRNPPELLLSMTEDAHHTIDRLAEQVTPHVQRLQDNLAGASDMLDERADQLRATGDAWLDSVRCTVRDNPLAAMGAALVLGLVVARLAR